LWCHWCRRWHPPRWLVIVVIPLVIPLTIPIVVVWPWCTRHPPDEQLLISVWVGAPSIVVIVPIIVIRCRSFICPSPLSIVCRPHHTSSTCWLFIPSFSLTTIIDSGKRHFLPLFRLGLHRQGCHATVLHSWTRDFCSPICDRHLVGFLDVEGGSLALLARLFHSLVRRDESLARVLS
jgi:hypothetical protein